MSGLSGKFVDNFFQYAKEHQGDVPALQQAFFALLETLMPEHLGVLTQAYQVIEQASLSERADYVIFVGHEIKNPLTSIRMSADLLAQGMLGPLTAPQREFIATIQRNTARIAALTTDLSDIARLEKGNFRLDSFHFPLRLALDEVCNGLSESLQAKTQTMQVDLPPELPLICGDHVRVVQVLEHLLRNAQMYTPANGCITVTAQASEPATVPALVTVIIRDNGIGIPAADQPRVFQKFFRADQRAVYEQSGSGLGLCLSYGLVKQMGGSLAFESVEGQGTTFTLTLPAVSQ